MAKQKKAIDDNPENDFFWEYKVKNTGPKLPKSRTSKAFKTKAKAKEYAMEKKAGWLQATLYQYKINRGYVAVAAVGVSGLYREDYL